MGTSTIGKVLVTAKLENLVDVEMRERGKILPEDVRTIEVTDALVDTGAKALLVPKRLIAQLGLRQFKTRSARGIVGTAQMPIYSAVRLTIQGRECALDVGEIDDSFPVLIGRFPWKASIGWSIRHASV